MHGLLTHKNIRIPIQKKIPSHNAIFGRTKEGNFKSCPIVLKFWVWLLRGWRRFFKGDFADTAPKRFRWCWWGAERRVKPAQTPQRGPPSAPAEFFILQSLVGALAWPKHFVWFISNTKFDNETNVAETIRLNEIVKLDFGPARATAEGWITPCLSRIFRQRTFTFWI